MINTQAKHTIVGARTERIESDPHFAGLQVSGTPVTLVEGGQVATLVLTATVPVLCSPQVVESCLLGTCLTFVFFRTGRWDRAASTSILPLAWQGRNSAAPGVDFCTGSESVRFLSPHQNWIGAPSKIPFGMIFFKL